MRRITRNETRGTRNGFTLLEIIMVLAILMVVMEMAYSALRINQTFRDLIFIRIQLYRENKRAHDAIAEELEKSQASRVNITNNAPPTPDEIRFQVPLINSIDNTTYDIPWGAPPNLTNGSICYWLNNTTTNLMRQVRDSGGTNVSAQIKATNIVDLQFSNVSGYIGINTKATKTTLSPVRTIEDTLNSTVYLLN